MKRLIVCFDGTWNAADSAESETNVARIARSIRANSGVDGIQQMVLYLRGVGTSGGAIQRLLAGATGLGVGSNIRSAYMFLAQNYVPARRDPLTGADDPADEIFLFGFSRGAFSARSLSGLIKSCGLLKRQRLSDVDKAWNYYRSEEVRNPRHFMANCNTDTHVDMEIRFLGVWDTVGALGIPGNVLHGAAGDIFEFHDTEPSSIVKHGAHALAIDEQRDEFVPTLWTGTAPRGSVIEQVWFAGCHSDVGGGYDDRSLADIPLRWMAERAETQGLQLDWQSAGLPAKDAALDPLSPLHDSRLGWSSKDRLTPTIRRVMEYQAPVTIYEKLYAPHDALGRPLRGIGERLHDSVLKRYRQDAAYFRDGESGNRTTRWYEPKNLDPAWFVT